MKGEELKKALLSKGLVKYDNVEYELHAIIYKVKNEKISVSVELLDKNRHCVVVAPAERVEGVA